jgi:hypothetical protein
VSRERDANTSRLSDARTKIAIAVLVGATLVFHDTVPAGAPNT